DDPGPRGDALHPRDPEGVAAHLRRHAVVAGGRGGDVAAVAVGVPRGEELAGLEVGGTEPVDEEPGADQLVVAGAGREPDPRLAGALPTTRRLGPVGGPDVALPLGAERCVGQAR